MQYRASLVRPADAGAGGDQADKSGQRSVGPTDNETASADKSNDSGDSDESASSFADEGFDSNAVLVDAGIVAAGTTTAGVLSGTSDGARAAKGASAEQAPVDDAATRHIAYQAAIADATAENARLQEYNETVATTEAAMQEGEIVDANNRHAEKIAVAPPVVKTRDARGDEMDPDGPDGAGSGREQDDIETGSGVSEEAIKGLSGPGVRSVMRRRLECLLLLLLVVGCALGVGFGTANRSSDDGNAPTLSPVVISGTPAPTILATDPSQTGSPTQFLATEPPVSAPTRAPTQFAVTELPVSAPTVIPTTLPPTTVAETSTPTSVPVTLPPTTVAETGTPTSAPVTLAPTIVAETASPTSVPTTEVPTVSPTRSPITDQDLLDLLVTVSFDNGTSILTQGTPQNLAYEWLANSSNLNALPEERKIQRYALATFFYSTDGDLWSNNVAWLSEGDECSWYSRSLLRPNCNSIGQYENLILGFNGVGGTLPPEVALLSELARIQLSGGTARTLTGSLPSELGLLTSLQSFSAHSNALTGSLPPDIGAWTALDLLDLGENKFSGSLPSEIGQMTALRGLNLTTNEFTGELPPTIGQLVGVEILSLADNSFEGSVPAQLGLLAQLQIVSLETNAFTSIPTEFGLLANLQSLTLFENSLTGTLHTELGGISSLRTLNMRSNGFTGPIPPQYGSLANLRELDLSANLLNGQIPSEIGQLARLLSLYVQSNRLSGQIPVELSFLTRMSEIRVDNNDLTGLPNSVCDVFSSTLPTFYLDCAGQPPEIACPPGTCCTYCCEDGVGCECVYAPGSPFEFLC
jgi:Leucine-rich repeat (LRR) protein